MLDWDDIRFFLATAREGSTLAASRRLGVSQVTVARRIAALERSLRLSLFVRHQSGYALSEHGQALLQRAGEAEAGCAAFEAEARALHRANRVTVRLTTNELLGNQVLLQVLPAFEAAFPETRLEIVTEDRIADLGKGEAEIALRAGITLQPAGLFGRKLVDDEWSVYCHRSYAERYGVPRSTDELAKHRIVGIETEAFPSPVALWLEQAVGESAIVLRRNSPAGLFAAIQAGLGVTIMSDLIASTDPGIVRCFRPPVSRPHSVWLLTHERFRHDERIRGIMTFLADRILERFRQTALPA